MSVNGNTHTSVEGSSRDYALDNVRGVLIVLVVYAHFVGNFFASGGSYNSTIWGSINSYHMCAFLIISGYLAKSRIDKKQYGKVIVGVFVPYLIAQFFQFFMFIFSGTHKEFYLDGATYLLWVRPLGALWYIFAVGVYVFVLSRLIDRFGTDKLWRIFFVSIVITLLMGYGKTVWYLRFTKLVCFFPYYLLGYILHTTGKFEILRLRKSRPIGAVAFIIGYVVLLALRGFVYSREDLHFLGLVSMEEQGRYGIHISNDLFWIIGPIARLVLMLLAITISLGLIALVPGRDTVISRLGRNSIYIYILHWHLLTGIKILCVRVGLFEKWFNQFCDIVNHGANVFLIALPLIIGLCFLLQSKPFRTFFGPFIQPNIDLSKIKEYL